MNTIVEPIEISFGDKLRKTRESLNLSLEDVAKATSLRPNILEKLENNEFVQKNVPATFLKGYLRSYTKFLRIPESEWANLDFGEVPKNDLDKNMRTMRSVNQYAPHGRWVGLLTSLVLLIVVGMTALWWWQNYQKSNEERDNLVQTYVEKEKTAEVPVTHLNEIPVVVNSHPTVSTNRTVSVTEATNNAVVEPVVSTTQENQAKTVNADVSTAATSAPTVEQAQAPVVEQTLPNTEPTTEKTIPDIQSAVENPAISEAQTTAKGDLVIEITKNSSWISVKDQNRKVLAQKEYKQGEILTFNGDKYALIIGAPGNVRITYKGEAYPLTVDGRVAKFKLPKP
ncbi:transcriptional regulator with an N-terminal xre-type HTH domain [Haemophilus parainfluenzae]|uniref:Transcriptional regulator with an N-terminal xre-type HTH domain n=1 Tax=Haemophilus parainfluenzae TaxID=729 RepID=A0A3S4VYQ1_HAEPA|nr:RodZ family helix-turn-helix domain-containing protein [Haemophilus parainfluenzae]VEI33696.1 transcriptional regulator with an N-terminal xre-type HTH domain [Haemophilus parainfluenzae]